MTRLLIAALLLTAVAVLGGTMAGQWWHAHQMVLHDAATVQAARATWQAELNGAVLAAQVKAKTKAQADIDAAFGAGQARERARQATDTLFAQLTEESTHDAPDPVDGCVLPAGRLRRWAAANAGAAARAAPAGAPAAQPAGAAAAIAAAGFRPHARPGGQPPAGGAGLSPPGQPVVRAADAAASTGDRGMPPVAGP